jgi:DNA-binding IclR family transcriptional regulator
MTPETTSEGDNGQERYLVTGLVRGVRILRLFTADRPVISAPEMAQELKIPRSTVFRLAQTLDYLGLLEKVEHGQAYRLGVSLLSLGFELLASLDIAELGRPIADALADRTGLSSHIVIRDGTDVVVVYKASGRSAFTGSLTVGSRLPAHATVLGRVILADLPEAEIDALYGRKSLVPSGKQTPVSVTELKALLAEDRERGYAVSDSFFEQGVSAIAAPVRDHTGRAVGAINTTILGSVAGRGDLEQLIAQVREAAAQLSNTLNYRPVSLEGQRRAV